jgi:hypothetical protein
MKEVIDAEGCMMINDDDVSIVIVKKTGNLSMREALNKAISLIREET